MHLETKLKNLDIDLIKNTVISVDVNNKNIMLANVETVYYDKLIIATGSVPVIPDIEGIEHCCFIEKKYSYLKELVKKVKDAKKITIIGGGFIGIELADELSKKNSKEITLIEAMPSLLPNTFDSDFSVMAKSLLQKKVNVKTGVKIEKIEKNGKTFEVSGEGFKINSDLIITAVGFKPNTDMFKNVLPMNEKGFIGADDYFRVTKDVFAIGDCVEHREFFTSNPTPLMLASTAAFDARVAAANLYELRIIRHNKDALNIYSTVIGDKMFAAVGITEQKAKEEGFEIKTFKTTTHSTHPPKFSHSTDVTLKLIFSKKDLYLLGAQMCGGINSAEIINILSLAIQKNATATDLYTMQIGTHPVLTPPPTFYPIAATAAEALKNT
jgi:pyruvate/2-oxoglutarate dehydrogenase complex dihydrolipoamide dehydrogenase (E3) component